MSLQANVAKVVTETVRGLFAMESDVLLSVPDTQFGDYATSVAMQLAGKCGLPPREIAEKIAAKLAEQGYEATVAGPGFINIHVSSALFEQELATVLDNPVNYGKGTLYQGKMIVTEYSDMNAFKTAHAGHLYTTIVGDVVSNILAAQGAEVKRTNFGGDVGLHVGKAMWAIMRRLNGDIAVLDTIESEERAPWVSACYVEGNTAYETDEAAKLEIIACNKQAYTVQETNEHDSLFARVYWRCREWSYEGFELFYTKLELHKPEGQAEHFIYYPESLTAPFGKKLVEEGLERGVFEVSDGAVVYKGEQDGLHTRVFLTSAGLPTYETKDLGLAVRKWDDFAFDKSIIITANDIVVYMKVVMAALKHFRPKSTERTIHLTHGLVKLAGGVKMSSRSGTVVTPDEIIASATLANKEATGNDTPSTVLAAVKYSFLKQKVGGDIIYDPVESVSILGNSGPYLQYAHARACSILNKASDTVPAYTYDPNERLLVRKITSYPDVTLLAAKELTPHVICTYLYELAQEFNRFYETNHVIGSDREQPRLALVRAYAAVFKNGLTLLGIEAPDRM